MLGLPLALLSLVAAAWAVTNEVDDRDSRIAYGGTWLDGGNSDEFQSTTKYTLDTGATARFTFTGTAIAVIGTVDLADATTPSGSSSYQLDGGTATTFNGTQAVSAGQRQTGITYFSTTGLASSEHTIVITNLGGKFVLDKITYEADETTTQPAKDPVTTPPTDGGTTTPGGTDAPSTTDPASSTDGPSGSTPSTTTALPGTNTRTGSTPTSTSPKTTSSSTPNGTSSNSSSPPNLAVIVGSSVGGAAALALLFLAGVIIKKRRDPSSPSSEKIDLETHPSYPLMATPPPPPASTNPYDPYTVISTPSPAPASVPVPIPPNRDASASAAPSQHSLNQPPTRPADELGYDTSLFSYLDESGPRRGNPPPWHQP